MRRKPRSDAVVVDRTDHDLNALLRPYLDMDPDAFEAVAAMSAHDPDQCWRFLELARAADLSDEQLAILSAGPFEDMMKRHGETFIARVEAAAPGDPSMRTLVGTLWRSGMNEDLWARVVALRTSLGIPGSC